MDLIIKIVFLKKKNKYLNRKIVARTLKYFKILAQIVSILNYKYFVQLSVTSNSKEMFKL